MTRTRWIWLTFAVCLTIVLASMAGVTAMVLQKDDSESTARRNLAAEQNIQLALWRMESAIGPIFAREAARPYFHYSAFYPAERAYTRMFEPLNPGGVLIPSPLLSRTPPFVVVHFQLAPDGELSSPQVPQGNMLDLAESAYVSPQDVRASELRLATLHDVIAPTIVWSNLPPATQPVPLQTVTLPDELAAAANAQQRQSGQTANAPAQQMAQQRAQTEQWSYSQRQVLSNTLENYGQTASNLKQIEQQIDNNRVREQQARLEGCNDIQLGNFNTTVMTFPNVAEGPIRALWIGDELVFVRRVAVDGLEYAQGCQLDWPAMRDWLLDGVRDLLPEAKLVYCDSDADPVQSRRLAAIPVRLIPGAIVPLDGGDVPTFTRQALGIAWIGMLAACIAATVLMIGAMQLSERRATFVSAVTHELRTPLTTFKLYTDLLADGMISDEGRRHELYRTMRSEADRLARLIENVLTFARLEHRNTAARAETITVAEFWSQLTPRVEEHLERCGMQLEAQLEPNAAFRMLCLDTGMVTQIVFNLADNACKYAGQSDDKRVHMTAAVHNGRVTLELRDHGPGIAPERTGRLFRPFNKSAHEAANSAPGIGLGLALSRRLARNLGGDLEWIEGDQPGATFRLSLPIASEARHSTRTTAAEHTPSEAGV